MPSVSTGAGGIGLHLNAQRALATIGLADAVRSVAIDLDAYYRLLPDGTEVVGQPYTSVWGSPAWAVHRADLNAALRAGVPPDHVALGKAVAILKRRETEVVVQFPDGSEREYSLVVAADGVRSSVRTSILGSGFVRYGGACFWRTTLPKCIVKKATASLFGSNSVGLIPLFGDRTHVFIATRVDEPFTDQVAGRVDRLRRRLEGGGNLVDKAVRLLGNDESVHFGRLEWVEPPAWGAGRVVLIGDAAHAIAPTLALGGAMAIEDAIVLAEELAERDSIDTAIERFKQRRDPRVRFVQERTRITWERMAGKSIPGEPSDLLALYRRNYEPLLEAP